MEQIDSSLNSQVSGQDSTMFDSCGYLEWDSDFFGFYVASIKVGGGSDRQVAEEIDRFQHDGCRLIYVHSPHLLDLSDFKAFLADRKRSYRLADPKFREPKKQIVSINENLSGLYNLAYQAGEYSRYKIDPNIDEEVFKRLYRLWIDNSVSRQFADYVMAAIIDDNPVGLITAKVKAEMLSIGLFATDKEYRGEGVGSDLIQSIVNIAAMRNLEVEVTTQADNRPACDFYERKGFKINNEEYIYHVWDA